ncbi:MAG: hypothetical protein ACREUU_01060 [Gammaproteobacteria bacterium]
MKVLRNEVTLRLATFVGVVGLMASIFGAANAYLVGGPVEALPVVIETGGVTRGVGPFREATAAELRV